MYTGIILGRMRITIIGHPGSGKSTLARAISKKLSIPHIHLDRLWFEGGGRANAFDTPDIERVRAYVREKTLEAIAGDSWVSDGLYARVQPEIAERADVVIFLDIPLWKRLYSHAKRALKPFMRHKELSWWDELKFFREIVRRTYSRKAKYQAILERFADKVVILRSWKEVDDYLARLQW